MILFKNLSETAVKYPALAPSLIPHPTDRIGYHPAFPSWSLFSSPSSSGALSVGALFAR